MSDTIIKRVLTRDMPDRSRIVATLVIHRIGGNAHPHFAATCKIYEPHGTWSGAARHLNGKDMDGGGASHSTILGAFPQTAPFVAMHLSDWPSGTPMHARANAAYWYFGGEREKAARTLRVKVDELPADATPEQFDAFVAAQGERWAREAQAAYELLETL